MSRARDRAWYEIRVEGQIDGLWSAWFDGLTVRHEADGQAILTGPVADQAALHGLLARVRDLGLPLLLVRRLELEQHTEGEEP